MPRTFEVRIDPMATYISSSDKWRHTQNISLEYRFTHVGAKLNVYADAPQVLYLYQDKSYASVTAYCEDTMRWYSDDSFGFSNDAFDNPTWDMSTLPECGFVELNSIVQFDEETLDIKLKTCSQELLRIKTSKIYEGGRWYIADDSDISSWKYAHWSWGAYKAEQDSSWLRQHTILNLEECSYKRGEEYSIQELLENGARWDIGPFHPGY